MVKEHRQVYKDQIKKHAENRGQTARKEPEKNFGEFPRKNVKQESQEKSKAEKY